MLSFCTNSTASLIPSTILEKNHVFFSGDTNFFPKNRKFRTFLEILLFQSHFMANSVQIGKKNQI